MDQVQEKAHEKGTKIKTSLWRSTTDAHVEALGKKSKSSKCKLMQGLKKCSQESLVTSGCNTIKWRRGLLVLACNQVESTWGLSI